MHIITQTHDSRFLGSWDPGSLKIECRNVKFLFQNLRYFVAKVFFCERRLVIVKINHFNYTSTFNIFKKNLTIFREKKLNCYIDN